MKLSILSLATLATVSLLYAAGEVTYVDHEKAWVALTGDVITIPAGTPHWFKEVPSRVNYYLVKVLKP